jgi:hypothetical protein
MAIKSSVSTIDDVDEKYRDLYTQRGDMWELTGIEGMKTQADVDRIQNALVKERADHKAAKDRLGLLGDRRVEDVLTMLDRIPELEAAASGKMDDDKLNQLVEGRLKSKTAPMERELKAAMEKIAAAQGVIDAYALKEQNRTISDAVRTAAASAKVLSEAMDDALLLAERVFEVDADGRVVTKDNVGVTPGLTPQAWLTDLQSKRPHWWPASVGGGASGSRTTIANAGNPWSSVGWNMTKQGQIVRENPAMAEQLAAAAGTSVGGLRPPAK